MITVVMPLYNKQTTCERAIQSVLSQKYTDFELLIINDGSVDESLDVVKRQRDERIKIINKENGGVSSARNLGILNANSEWIAFLDADDEWDCDFLKELNSAIIDFPDAGMIGTAYKRVNGANEVLDDDFHLPSGYRGYLDNYFANALKHTLFHSSAVAIKKSVCTKSGLFDEALKYGEDTDMWIRVNLHFRTVFVNRVLSRYNLWNDENSSMNKGVSFHKHILSVCFEKYQKEKSKEFRLFLNTYVLKNMRYFYFSKTAGDDLKAVLNQVPFSFKYVHLHMIYWCPKSLAQFIYRRILMKPLN